MDTDLQRVYDSGYGCVGTMPQLPEHGIWFSPWFLKVGRFEDPSCTWVKEGDVITHTQKHDGDFRKWKLTGEVREDGWQLGRWAD